MLNQRKLIAICFAIIFLTVVALIPFSIGDDNDAENLEIDLIQRESSPIETNSMNAVALLINSEMIPIDFNHSSPGLAKQANPVNSRVGVNVELESIGQYTGLELVGDTLYFDASDFFDGTELWAYDTSNSSLWQVADIADDCIPSSQICRTENSNPGKDMGITVVPNKILGDTLYFDATTIPYDVDRELWAHNTRNSSTWQVTDFFSGRIGVYMDILVGDTLYFDATDGISGREVWAHDTSNSSTWQIADINTGENFSRPGELVGSILVDDTIYFSANDGITGSELWAHNTSNFSTWQVADIRSGFVGSFIPSTSQRLPAFALVDDTLFFSASDGSGLELWAHNTSNLSTWLVRDINSANDGRDKTSSYPGDYSGLTVVESRVYFSATDYSHVHAPRPQLWVHETKNGSTWQVVNPADDMNSAGLQSYSATSPGFRTGLLLVGETLYFSGTNKNTINPNGGIIPNFAGHELWAHNTSNSSTWMVKDIHTCWEIPFCTNSSRIQDFIQVRDRIYFEAENGICGRELWVHNITTDSTFQVTDINPEVGDAFDLGSWSPGGVVGEQDSIYQERTYHEPTMSLVGNDLYFLADDGVNGTELWLLDTTVNSSVSCGNQYWDIEPDLPAGLLFDSTTGTISGTPTETTSPILYTIWANSSIDSYSTTIEISVLGALTDVCGNDDVWFSEIHPEGEPNDWIELQNNASTACSLLGWKLYNQGIVDANGANDDQILTFGYVELDHVTSGGSVVWGIRDDNIASFTFEFDIFSSGDTLYLESPDGSTVHEVVIASWTVGDGSWQNCRGSQNQASWDWTSNTNSMSPGNFNDCLPLDVGEEDSQGLPGFRLTICLLSILSAVFFSNRHRL